MKVASFAILFLPPVQANIVCRTIRGQISKEHVPTHVSTTRITTDTDTIYKTSAVTVSTNTYVHVVGETTITIPTHAVFTPLVSAPTSTSTYPFYYAKFPESVECTSTVRILTGSRPFRTITAYVGPATLTYPATTLTSHVPTSTAYAACAVQHGHDDSDGDPTDDLSGSHGTGPNVLHSVHGNPIAHYVPSGDSIHFPNKPSPLDSLVGRTAVTCCEWAQRENFTGYSWNYGDILGLGDRRCFGFDNSFIFSDFVMGGPPMPGYRIGNGPRAVSGIYLNIRTVVRPELHRLDLWTLRKGVMHEE